MKNYILLLSCLFLFLGCGARGGSAPPGSTITISTPSGTTNPNTDFRTDSETLVITVKDSKGNGVENARLLIDFLFTNPPDQNIISDLSGIVTLCDGTHFLNSPVDKKTDSRGVYLLCIMYQDGGGLKYSGRISVVSGDQSATADLAVQ